MNAAECRFRVRRKNMSVDVVLHVTCWPRLQSFFFSCNVISYVDGSCRKKTFRSYKQVNSVFLSIVQQIRKNICLDFSKK